SQPEREDTYLGEKGGCDESLVTGRKAAEWMGGEDDYSWHYRSIGSRREGSPTPAHRTETRRRLLREGERTVAPDEGRTRRPRGGSGFSRSEMDSVVGIWWWESACRHGGQRRRGRGGNR